MRLKFKPKFDHIGIVVKNLENVSDFLSKLFETDQPSFISAWEEGRYTMIPTDGPDSTKIEPLEPKKGWLLDFLRANGEMAVAEICFRVYDIEEFYDKVRGMGLTPVDDYGVPLVDKKYFLINDEEGVTAKCFYFNLPLKPNQGPAFEIIEYSPEELPRY